MTNADTPDTSDDKPKLKPANQNPWYVLATLHGEQTEGAKAWDPDTELHAKNRRDWNKWASAALTKEQREALLARKDESGNPLYSKDELTSHTGQNLKKLEKDWQEESKKRGCKTALPYAESKQILDFSNTMFERALLMNGFIFPGDASFYSATFSGDAGFNSATFSGHAGFSDARFQSSTSFAKAKFLKHPPKFHGATLHEGTAWHGAIWPPTPEDQANAQQHVYNYERLKQEMERLKKHEDELKFFALEMRAKRVVDGKRLPAGLMNAAYDVFSAYGRSVARPFHLMWIVGFMAVIIENVPKTNGNLPATAEAWGLSLANTFAILPFIKDAVSRNELAPLTTILGVIQGSIGALMLFLIGLGLRNRFRLK